MATENQVIELPPESNIGKYLIGFVLGFIILVAGGFVLINNYLKGPTKLPLETNEQEVFVSDGTVSRLNGLSVGAGNIWTEDYTDVNGNKKKGITALLDFGKTENNPNTKFRVYVGQEFSVEDYSFRVLGIHKGVYLGAKKIESIKKE